MNTDQLISTDKNPHFRLSLQMVTNVDTLRFKISLGLRLHQLLRYFNLNRVTTKLQFKMKPMLGIAQRLQLAPGLN